MAAFGKEFDGKLEGVNLRESAIGVGAEDDPSLTQAGYVKALKANMSAVKRAFPRSVTMQYANSMKGEWLPWKDKGYLKSIYPHGEAIGVGLGASDLMPRRKGQLNHVLAMMHEGDFSVPLGNAVQDGNYVGVTGSSAVKRERILEGAVYVLVEPEAAFRRRCTAVLCGRRLLTTAVAALFAASARAADAAGGRRGYYAIETSVDDQVAEALAFRGRLVVVVLLGHRFDGGDCVAAGTPPVLLCFGAQRGCDERGRRE